MTEWQAFRHPQRLYTLHHPPDWTVTVDEALGQVILRPPFPPHSYLDITVHLLTDEQWQSLGGIQGLMDTALQAVWRATPQSWWQRIWQRFLLPSKPSIHVQTSAGMEVAEAEFDVADTHWWVRALRRGQLGIAVGASCPKVFAPSFHPSLTAVLQTLTLAEVQWVDADSFTERVLYRWQQRAPEMGWRRKAPLTLTTADGLVFNLHNLRGFASLGVAVSGHCGRKNLWKPHPNDAHCVAMQVF